MSRCRAAAGAFLLVAIALPSAALSTVPMSAQERPASVRAYRTTAPVRLDGLPDESAWRSADSITDLLQSEPQEGVPGSEHTVVRFLLGEDALYIGVWCHDRDPQGIRHSQLRRDAAVWDDDYVSILLDAAFDRRSGVVVLVNPNGAIWDGEVANPEFVDGSWNGMWDARARIGPDGWTAELVVPLQMLRLRGGTDRLGLNVGRIIRRKNEVVMWRGWRRQHGFLFQDQEGALEGLAPFPPRRLLELRPYAATTYATGVDVPQAETPMGATAGVDAKLALTGTLTLDATVNTDFAQADVDDQVLNLSRFPVFFPEKREFFLESAPIFDFGAPGSVKVFHSRRIGLDTAGAPVPIRAGLRLTGRAGAQRIGLLAVRTAGTDDAMDLVARVRRDVLSRGSFGGIMTLQTGPGHRDAPATLGVDMRVPLFIRGHNVVPSGYAATSVGGAGRPAEAAWRLSLEYPNDRARHGLAVGRIGPGFDPALGFLRQAGVWEALGALRFYPRPERWGIRRLLLSLVEADLRLNGRWLVDNGVVSVRPIGAEFESGDWVEFYVRRYEDVPADSFALFPGVAVAPGRYVWHRAELGVASDNARPVAMGLTASAGSFYTGTSKELTVEPSFRLPPHLVASVSGGVRWIRLPQRRFTAQVFGMRLDYATSTRLAATARVQWENESRDLAVNARVHWMPRPGRDLYVVYTTTWPTPAGRGIPWGMPNARSVIAKLVWYFRP